MQSTMMLFVALIVSGLCVIAVTGDEFAPIYNFNKGKVETGKSCSSSDWDKMKLAMGKVLGGRRQLLRQGGNNRNLGTFCDYCRLSPTCMAMVGKGCAHGSKRRLLTEWEHAAENEHGHRSVRRELTVNGTTSNSNSTITTQCDAQVRNIDAAFTALRPSVSQSCRNLMDAPRDIICAWYTQECNINYYSLWSAESESMLIPKFNATNGSYCTSLGRVTFKAETTFFLGKVQFDLYNNITGASLRRQTEHNAPYYVHGNDGANVHGSKLAPGKYLLSAVSENDPDQTKILEFEVRDC